MAAQQIAISTSCGRPSEQLQATKAVETFFEFPRGRLSLQEWSVQWQINREEEPKQSRMQVST